MTNPPQGPDDHNSWARPPQGAPQGPPPAQPTERIPHQGPPDPVTQHIPRSSMDDPTQATPQASPQWYPPPQNPYGGPQVSGAQPPVPPPEEKDGGILGWLKDPLSLALVLVIVVALAVAGVIGGELYARKRADEVVGAAVACIVKDQATASFGFTPPFLWQHMTGHYTNISIETAGNQIREAKGMKVNIDIKDVRLEDTGTSSGSIGSLVANIAWSSDGIKQTVQDVIPLFGGIVSSVTTNPNDGTIQLEGALGSVTAKPQVVDGGLSLQVLQVTGLGFTLPRETVQPALDAFTGQLTKNYPMGITADSVEVTDSGVQSQFSSHNASIPRGEEDPCFAGL
ncbi:LmeA family phospholipid-binding protein [Mycolicibacterium mengxianglii]|uniref:LmeA family phospholipid-binding protein n=1 Tax=Mycolicibacterium mengxianglii TaxID=2736649 RepID=UPI0027DA3438|nr:DUF2993 domain-containing protein [Mycolicibacterium mengxianglii]